MSASGGTPWVRRAAVVLASSGLYGTAVYVSYSWLANKKRPEFALEGASNGNDNNTDILTSPHRSQRFQTIASCYDDEIGRDEFFMGIGLLRRSLLFFHARGQALEVGAGTARNLSAYPKSVRRVLLTDASDKMLEQALEKIKSLSIEQQARFAVLQASAENLSALPNQSFDTVVDTFGLCSYDDPKQVLREMDRVCKPNGKILLLEHGRSKTWDFVTKHLDEHAESHARNWGCVWNRDLDELLEQSGLKVETLHRWHFGSTYYVVCRSSSYDSSRKKGFPHPYRKTSR